MSAAAAWLVALVIGIVAAGIGYGRQALRRPAFVPAILRGVALTLLALALLDAPVGTAARQAPIVALDASASMAAHDSAIWRAARDSARGASGAAMLVFGDSARTTDVDDARPAALASRVGDAVRQATAAGRPLVVVTDGALDDPDALAEAPAGSRVVVVTSDRGADLAIADLDTPAAAAPGDTLRVAVAVAGRGTVAGARLRLRLDGRVVDERPVPAPAAGATTRVELSVTIPAGGSTSELRAELVTDVADAVPANDTVAVAIQRDAAAQVVVASTAPDADVRDLVAVVRQSSGAPVRAFFRVAPGRWVLEGALAAVGEEEVRRAVRGASLAVLHGDTAWAGPPATLAARALFLVVPPTEAPREGYVRAAPPSPLQPALAGLEVDSLPPLLVGRAATGGTVALTAAPTPASRLGDAVLVVREGSPRRAVLAAGGWSRWRRRGGVGSVAFQALVGAPLDWLVAARPRRATPTVPPGVLRAGVPLRITRGAADTATLALVRDGDRRRVEASLAFAGGATADAPALDAGTWRGRLGGAPVVLVVNAARELLPRAATVRAGPLGGEAAVRRRGARTLGWLYLAAALALAAEWLLRRRAGLR
jgi:hypothetical protein